MEGTRHEKALIIVSAYVIGFITAFIAFGISKTATQNEEYVSFDLKTSQAEESAQVHDAISVNVGSDGLYLVTGERERLLSANRNALSASVQLAAAEPGFFYQIVDAEASRDGSYVYYCEQLTEEAANCDPYVYVIADDTLYRVKSDGQLLYPISSSHESMWSGESTLIVNGFVALDAERPWELSTVEEVFAQ
jgi:hypothetical protein